MYLNRGLSVPIDLQTDEFTIISDEDMEREAIVINQAKCDVSYFKILYEKYFKDIYAFVFHRIKDKVETADITSQVFLKALLNIKSFKCRGIPFSAWLYKIALNEVNQYFRKEKKLKSVIINDHALQQISNEVEDQNLAYRKDKLERILQTLSTAEMDLIELRFQLGMSYKEIACVINSSEINARVKLHRLIDKIKNKWGLK